MLTPGWYLPDADWFAQLSDAPQPPGDVLAALDQLAALFRDDPAFGPAQTVAATHVILLGAEHLGDTLTHAPESLNVTEVVRLLSGLNVVVAHLTQTIQRLAGHTNDRTLPGLQRAPDNAVQALASHLSTAGTSGEIVAGHLKQAHLILRCGTADQLLNGARNP